MATIPTYFTDFLSNIRLTDSQRGDCATGHATLRDRLAADDDLSPIIVGTFLQGSYKRSTAIRPTSEKAKSDVDVVVVTTMDRTEWTPRKALNRFLPFLEKHYHGKYEEQGRSWGIKLSYVELDLVPTSAPSEAIKDLVKSASLSTNMSIVEAKNWRLSTNWDPNRSGGLTALAVKEAEDKWKKESLWIPDREAEQWDETHPLAQLSATSEKNSACNGHYVNVVKAIKWWRTSQQPKPKYPKSYPLEHLLWINCPNAITSVAEGVVMALEAIRDNYRTYAVVHQTPFIPDHGVPAHNVLGRVSGEDFAAFHSLVNDAADQARRAFDEPDKRKSASLWRDLFGDKFPEPPPESNDGNDGSSPNSGGYTPRKDGSIIGGGRFAMNSHG